MNKKLISLFVSLILLVVILSGCSSRVRYIRETINISPNAIITNDSIEDGFEGSEYSIYVRATVYNKGAASGRVNVYAKLIQDNSSWEKYQNIHLWPEESKDLVFTFKNISSWDFNNDTYQVWVMDEEEGAIPIG